MSDWIITSLGTPGQLSPQPIYTFPSLGLSNPHRSLTNAGRDRFTFSADGRPHDADGLFDFGSRVSLIHPNGTRWFEGVVTTLPRYTSGPAEGQSYEVSGPMYQLEQNVFKLLWPGVAGTTYTSHVILNYAGTGLLRTTRAMIALILDYALSVYPSNAQPFKYALTDILPGTAVYPPIDEVRDILCSEALRRCMRWHPRSVLWFDYTTSPPSLHISAQSGLTSVLIPGGDNLPASKVTDLQLSPRYDIQRPSVAITYEVKSTINGQDLMTFPRDIAPAGATGLEEGCRNLSLDLKGVTRNFVSAYVETTPIDINDIEWWKGHIPLLKNSTVMKNLSIKALSPVRMGSKELGVEIPSLELPYEVTSKGQFPGWLKRTGILVQRERVRAILTYDVFANDGTTILHHGELLQSVSITATDALTDTYTSLEDAESADPQPIGLAQFLYDEIKNLQWDVSFVFTEAECLGVLTPGKVVNISGSRAEFSTMNAIVQSVEEDLKQGISTVKCGPMPGHEPADILELIRVTRPRVRYTAPKTFDDGDVSEGIELGEETADENGVLAAARENLKTIRDEASGKSIVLNAGYNSGDAHVTITDGTKIAKLLGSASALYITDATNIVDLQNSQLSGHGPAQWRKLKVCVKVGGADKARTCYIAAGPVFQDTDDPA